MKKIREIGKEQTGNMGHYEKTKPSNYGSRWGHRQIFNKNKKKVPPQRKDTPLQITWSPQNPNQTRPEWKPYHSSNTKHKSHIKENPSNNIWYLLGILKARIGWSNALQVLKDRDWKPILIYTAKLSVIIEVERKIFHDETT